MYILIILRILFVNSQETTDTFNANILNYRSLWMISSRTGNKHYLPQININSLIDYKNPVEYSLNFLEYDIDDACVDVYQSTMFSGYCSLPEYCNAAMDTVTSHTWYGNKVHICVGINKNKLNYLHNLKFKIYSLDFDMVKREFQSKNFSVVIQNPYRVKLAVDSLHNHYFIPKELINNLLIPNYVQVTHPVGNWHEVYYHAYQMATIYQHIFNPKYSFKSISQIPYSPFNIQFKSHLLYYSCSSVPRFPLLSHVAEFTTYSPIHLVTIQPNYTIDLNAFKYYPYSNKPCVKSYKILDSNKDIKIKIVRTKTQNLLSHSFEYIGKAIVTGIDYLFEKILQFVTPMIDASIHVIILLFDKLLNTLVDFIESQSDDLDYIIVFLVKFLSTILKLLVKLIVKLDSQINFFEYLCIFLLINKYLFSHPISALVCCLPFYLFFPVDRFYPSILGLIYYSLYNITVISDISYNSKFNITD